MMYTLPLRGVLNTAIWFIHYHYEVYSIQQYDLYITITRCTQYSKMIYTLPLRGVLNTAICDTVCQWLAAGWCFYPGTPVSSTNKTYHHDVTELLLKVLFNTTVHNPYRMVYSLFIHQHQCSSVRHTSVTWQVSEWLLLNTNSAIVQLYWGENMLIFNEMMMRSALF